MTKFRILTATAAAAAVSMALAAPAMAEDHVAMGTLDCDVSGGLGLILGSQKKMNCTFKKKDGGVEDYTGKITKVGIDIGKTTEGHIIWEVFATKGKHDAGELAGTYAGVGGEVTIAGGIGANVLVGGFKNSFALQPFSVSTQAGANIALAVETVTLEYVAPAPASN
ncbi:DUF992 domain-containing protein [Chachezhania sediminis]|uniref:DUF992 domain-containing protein n=1 Tax=Chachezhania sediminis TaxID=2599291 RepID=UPI00131AC565|nr:DUF992 domain-containing protein [Chachezhania sediminis]